MVRDLFVAGVASLGRRSLESVMLAIVNGYERGEQSELFDAMFHLRKKVFFDQKSWDMRVNSSREIDEFDRDDTVYLCSLGSHGELLGTVRLLNTITDHMAINIFGSLFKNVDIRSPTVWEATCFAVAGDPVLQPNGVSRAACELMLGIFTFGLEYGVSQVTAIYEAPLGAICRRSGINYRILGTARMDPAPTIFFSLTDISRQLENSVRSATGLLLEKDKIDARAA